MNSTNLASVLCGMLVLVGLGGRATAQQMDWLALLGQNMSLWDVDWALTQRLNPGIQDLHKHDRLLAASSSWVIRRIRGDFPLELPQADLQKFANQKVLLILQVYREQLELTDVKLDKLTEYWIITQDNRQGLLLYICAGSDNAAEHAGRIVREAAIEVKHLEIPKGRPIVCIGIKRPNSHNIDFWLVLELIRIVDLKQ